MSERIQDQRRWFRLTKAAQEEVDRVLAVLPAEVRERLQELPITFDLKPNTAMVAGGLDELGTLGLFTGVPYSRAIEVSQRLPPQIILFLENIYRYARGDAAEYREQVRRTLLHEIGHFLGLDENEVGWRGL